MFIDQVIPGLSLLAGGPTRTVLQLTDSLAAIERTHVRLITQSTLGQEIPRPHTPLVDLHVGESTGRMFHALGLTGRATIRGAIQTKRPDLLHCNGIWHPLNHWCASAARRHDIPLIIQPHGMLQPWALAWHATRKRLALAFYQQRDLDLAALLIATAEQEAEHLRQFGLRQPIAVIPNGIDLRPSCTETRLHFHRSDGIRRALFLGRVHPVKGLLNLIDAWSALNPQGWLLQIAGPDEDGHLAQVLARAERLGIADRVQYMGEFDDEAKWSVYHDADLFVLPSITENFGVVVAEALSVGLPVITTTGTPWQDLQAYDCGWWVSPTVAGLRDALANALMSPPHRLGAMGKRGHDYVQRYAWFRIAAEMREAYRWVLGRGPQPKCVRLE